MLRRLLPLAVVLASIPAAAQEDDEPVPTSLDGVGRISIQAGWRVTSNETLYKGWYGRAGNENLPRAREVAGGPVAMGTFAYAINDMVELGVDLFVTGGRLYLNERVPDTEEFFERRIDTLAYGAMVGLRFQTVLPEVGPYGLLPFIGLSTGPALVSSQRQDEALQEGITQAWAGSLGATLRLSAQWGVTAEYRLAFIRGPVGPPDLSGGRIGSFSLGGSWLALGVTYSFPPDPSRPFSSLRP